MGTVPHLYVRLRSPNFEDLIEAIRLKKLH